MTSPLSAAQTKAAGKITLFALDVDGVMTDGKITINDDGVESKSFNVRDGMAIALALKNGYQVAIISGRYSKVVERRAAELKIKHVHQDIGDKQKIFRQLLAKLKLEPSQAAFMGDDINDVDALKLAGFSGAPADADPTAKKAARWVSQFPGGRGAVRELIQMVMTLHGKWPRPNGISYPDKT
jgi:3-deoxy-D-manno-octulosonate 8-phosphate phosphatase (KDO 8-P phosphatase)